MVLQHGVILHIVGILLVVFSGTMLPPFAVAFYFQDGQALVFLGTFGVILGIGATISLLTGGLSTDLRRRDGFVVVILFWVVLGTAGALPLLWTEAIPLSLEDAVFESLSGLTTTGATVIVGLDELPPSLLFYRQELQWLGGMGIIVLAVAVLPMLGVGGMQLYRAETPGPIKDTKLTPRIAETAKALWFIYVALTVACALAYHVAGMSWFNAIAHAGTTVATGGFSPHDASLGHYDSAGIQGVAVVFMILGSANFGLHFLAFRSRGLRPYFDDDEFRAFLAILGSVAAVTIAYLLYAEAFSNAGDALRHGLFQAVSITTTTGFTTAEYFAWPGFLPVLLLFGSFIGGCGSSTTGGMKVIRFLLLIKQGFRELKQLLHPSAEIRVKLGNRAVPDPVINAVWGFFSIYVALFVVMLLLLMASGLDQVTAFSAVAACMNNLGPGLGDVAAHYGDINGFAKWVLCAAMLFGRLELFTLLVLFTPEFWRH